MGEAKLLVVAWDGADRITVDTLIERGVLPNLAKLRARGGSGTLASLPGLADDASWSSIATTVEPGIHGRFHHLQPAPDSYRSMSVGRDRMTTPPFWELVARAGRRVAVLDIPKSLMGHDRNLRELANWMPHGEDPGGVVSSPFHLARRVAQRHAGEAPFDCHRLIEPGDVASFTSSVLKRLRLRAEIALEWLTEESWDLFLVAFAESHCIGHHCWHLHDADHPAHDPTLHDTIGDPVAEVYRAQDEALGELTDAAGPDATVVVFSPLGMGPNYSGDRFVDEILRRLDGRPDEAICPAAGSAEPTSRLWGWAAAFLSPFRNAFDDRAFKDRRYFHLQHDATSSAVRLNVAGREPAGVIQPGADYDSHCETLSEEFLAIRDPACDRRLVEEVVKVVDRYPGPFADRFADLLVVWSNRAPITALASPGIGTIKAGPSPERTGNHRDGGWFVLASGDHSALTMPHPCSLVDLGPVIAGLLAVSLPEPESR
ncbi:MAG: alkaline phosphatase family protein [Deltaproteobacteria bacterium]|nr:alkaline phosphatase family protein [Deltaproteobacteria bacterium]